MMNNFIRFHINHATIANGRMTSETLLRKIDSDQLDFLRNIKSIPNGRKKYMPRIADKTKSSLAWICVALLNLAPPGMAVCHAAGWGGVTGGDGLPAEADCRVCHDDLLRFPLLAVKNVNKHHLLLGSPVVEPTAPPDAVPADTYECLSCHPLVWDAAIPGYTVSLYRDCLACHAVETVSGPPRMTGTNRHHQLDYDCGVCHDGRR
jgi:hypothetical protein